MVTTSPDPLSPEPPRPRALRHDTWSREKMALFLRELAASQSVAHAAAAVGMSRQSAYRLKNRLVGTPFALGWEVALELGLSQLAHAVLDRAINGVEVPHYYHGELVGTSRRYDGRLSTWVLENPWKIGRSQIAREYTAEAFDTLLERIENAAFDWEEGESLPGREADLGCDALTAEEAERRFIRGHSWYAANTSEPRRTLR